jgi:hypothetical protein
MTQDMEMTLKKVLTSLALLIVLGAPLGLAGCQEVVGSGEMATWDMDYNDFNRLEIGSAFDATITRDNDFLVRITIDKKLYEYLKIDQRGDTLRIRLKSGYTYTGTKQQATITLPDLRHLTLSGGSKAVVGGFSVTHSLDFSLSGGSRMELEHTIAGNCGFSLSGASSANGSLEMNDGKFNLSGESWLVITGSGDSITIDASGASEVMLGELATTSSDVRLSGGSYALINVSDRMDVHLSGGSQLEYIGNPKLGKLDMSGDSQLNQKQ